MGHKDMTTLEMTLAYVIFPSIVKLANIPYKNCTNQE